MTTVIRYYMGRFRVPRWLFEVSPDWLHRVADVSIRPVERGSPTGSLSDGPDGVMTRWLGRIWRWKVEVRPVPNLLLYAVLYALVAWFPMGVIGTARQVLVLVIAMPAALAVVLFVSAWRQGRKTRRPR